MRATIFEKDKAMAQRAWEIAKEKLSGDFQLVILDEITYTITYKFLDLMIFSTPFASGRRT